MFLWSTGFPRDGWSIWNSDFIFVFIEEIPFYTWTYSKKINGILICEAKAHNIGNVNLNSNNSIRNVLTKVTRLHVTV